jgi:hypothetical protein
LLENIDQAQKKQKRTYAAKKRCIMFYYFREGKVFVNMQKLGKKKSLLPNWEGPYLFVGYKDEKGC